MHLPSYVIVWLRDWMFLMSDPQIITAYAAGTATVLGAVTVLLAELRQWRRGRGSSSSDHPPGSEE